MSMEHMSTGSSRSITAGHLAILAAAALVGAGIYLALSARVFAVGFPLDDSWIHLTYARNLALHGEWSFQPGQLSAGSTAPLWTFLLTLGFWLRLGPYVWTYLLGELSLLSLAALAEWAVRRQIPTYRPHVPWVGIFFVAEWHLQWAALSGMETLLQALLMTLVLVLLMIGMRRYLLLGVLTGLSLWVRPDGLTLLGPVGLVILLAEHGPRAKALAVVRYLTGLAALLIPYVAFNLWLSGTPMPNTFYAKQAEYAAWQARPLLVRIWVLMLQLFTGPGVILLPGVVGWLILSLRRRNWASLAAMAWCGGYLLLYILRLPAYQHGRYLMPAMPLYFLCGLLALLEFQTSTLMAKQYWLARAVWMYSLVLVTVGFVMLGARSYANDVGLIESEMVATAKWADAHLPPDALVAAHDIGALGYFDRHQLIDLAGLISPEVVPFIRDENRLASYLDYRHADYLIAFPAFYPALTSASEPVFTTHGPFAPAIGEQNMTVYKWFAP
jgi:hypothetical protein